MMHFCHFYDFGRCILLNGSDLLYYTFGVASSHCTVFAVILVFNDSGQHIRRYHSEM